MSLAIFQSYFNKNYQVLGLAYRMPFAVPYLLKPVLSSVHICKVFGDLEFLLILWWDSGDTWAEKVYIQSSIKYFINEILFESFFMLEYEVFLSC